MLTSLKAIYLCNLDKPVLLADRFASRCSRQREGRAFTLATGKRSQAKEHLTRAHDNPPQTNKTRDSCNSVQHMARGGLSD